MNVSPRDPPLVAMDLSKSYKPLTRSHAEALDLAKKPEWYHRRPPSCSTDVTSAYRTRASSSYNSLPAQPDAPVRCRDMEPGPESMGNYVNSSLAPGLDLYRDRVHSNLWHPGFYGPDRSGSPVPESSGGEEESESGSDVIVLFSSSKEPLLCGSFIQDGGGHMVAPLSPAASSPDEGGRSCYHLPQPLSSPSPDSSYSDESSDSSADIPVHHTRPVVLLSDLGAVYGNAAESAVDISSDDSDVVEVSVTNHEKKSRAGEKTPRRQVRRSTRIRQSVSEAPAFSCSASRHTPSRQVKNNAVGIYNESCDSDDAMEYAVRLSSSDESASRPNLSRRASSESEESDVDVRPNRKSPRGAEPEQRRRPSPRRKASESINRKRKKPLDVPKTKKPGRNRQNCRVAPQQRQKTSTCGRTSAGKKTVARRKRKRRPPTGPSALFSPREPEIKLKYAKAKEKKDKKSEGFFPFVHVERRSCTVVNYQEDEAAVRSGRGGPQPAALGSLSGFVPSTSCYQLGRLGADGRCPDTLLCCMCGQTANATGLGDLHGPYRPAGGPSGRTQPRDDGRGRRGNSDDDDGDGRAAVRSSPDRSDPKAPPLRLDECWIHEDCGIWSAGVFLVRGRLYGLEEAARLAHETICSTCQQTGAIMGCFQKGCPRNYHHRCATQSGCVLNEENFSMRCPEHKNKPFRTATRRHKR
ncbi:transcription factor 20-like [Embiotoca jacksoni]|uniref:transcription factor 20-like n=1 Tax=Embiotoca jacksoni TaxID=100190 RepID=UPI003703D9D1